MVVRSTISHHDDRIVVVIGKDQSARSMRRTVLQATEGRHRDLVIDMRQVAHLSSQGIALLLGMRARQGARMRRLTLVCDTDSATEQALSRTGMRDKFTTVTGTQL